MKIVMGTYTIIVEEDELVVKTAAKLTRGEELFLKRINDEEDTFEIGVYTKKDALLGLLSYGKSVGIAPYMDRGLLKISASVGKTEYIKGAKKSRDKVKVIIWAEYTYDESLLGEISGEYFGFICPDNRVLSAFIAFVAKGGTDIVMEREYLNYFTCHILVRDEVKDMFRGARRLECSLITDEKFSKCKVRAKVFSENESEGEELPLTEDEKETVLTFVNHTLIFRGEDGINPEIEG